MQELRREWYAVLENLLQCPVCLDIPQANIIQCINGHTMCHSCQIQLASCPLCKGHFIPTRNLFAEQLAHQIPEVKHSLVGLHIPIEDDKITVSTQTSFKNETMSTQTDSIENSQLAPRVGKGLYPCRIGSCTVELAHGRMIGHLRYYHKSIFYEFPDCQGKFFQKWQINYHTKEHSFAFYIRDMGIFFLKVIIQRDGGLEASVTIVNCVQTSKLFVFKLDIGDGKYSFGRSGSVQSCRVPDNVLFQLQMPNNILKEFVNNKNSFECLLEIQRIVCEKAS